MITSTDLIQELNLLPHPEGGYYAEFHRSGHVLEEGSLPEGFKGHRNLGTTIYYMLAGNDISVLHRLPSEEIWHFHHGSAFLLHLIDQEGNYRRVRLGLDVLAGEVPCFAIPSGCWFAAEVAEEMSFALASCTVIPGFSFEDLLIPSRKELTDMFPHLIPEITRLTRK